MDTSLAEFLSNALANTGATDVKTRAWRLLNAWPKLLASGTQALPTALKALPAPASALPALAEGAGLPASLGARVAGGAVGGPLTAGALAGAEVMKPQPTNQGEQPFYVIDPTTGKMVPNPAAAGNMPPGSYGFGGGYIPAPTPPAPQAPTDAFGSTPSPFGSGGPPMPQARPAAANAPLDLSKFMQSPQPATGPSLIQKFMDMLHKAPSVAGTDGQSQAPFGYWNQ